jgi:hypothetical protein
MVIRKIILRQSLLAASVNRFLPLLSASCAAAAAATFRRTMGTRETLLESPGKRQRYSQPSAEAVPLGRCDGIHADTSLHF